MKQILIIVLTLLYLADFGQSLIEISPKPGSLINKSTEGEIEFIREMEKCESLWRQVKSQEDFDDLSAEDKKKFNDCTRKDYWDVFSLGSCSWYCGGGGDTASASSELKTYKGIKYSASCSHDFSYKTAWIEGIPGYGIGEYLVYHFPPENPRITKVIIVNGYVKSLKNWQENSRVKRLKMYLDNKPFAILNLADTRQEQVFSFDPIGNGERGNLEKLKSKPWWTMKFEIMEVYKGDKYDDTAITEIYFDGIDVH
jgi:hypothetical protein